MSVHDEAGPAPRECFRVFMSEIWPNGLGNQRLRAPWEIPHRPPPSSHWNHRSQQEEVQVIGVQTGRLTASLRLGSPKNPLRIWDGPSTKRKWSFF